MTGAAYDVVIPTIGRPNVETLLRALAMMRGAQPASVTVVDDRPRGTQLRLRVPPPLDSRLLVLRGFGRGPAAARNLGWRCGNAAWVVFLDDDVLVTPRWAHALEADLHVAPDVAAVQGHVVVPLPSGRRPTDWERSVHGLERASWITADMAVRRTALEDVGGFDERFPRAYREDADMALRLLDRGWNLARGERLTLHLVTPASPWVSVRAQAGNADDVLMEALHGRGWRVRAGAAPGCIASHRLNVGAALGALGLLLIRSTGAALPRGTRAVACASTALWGMTLARFAWRRIAPGPRTRREVATMLVTSPLIPPAAVWHRMRGHWRVWRNGIRRQPPVAAARVTVPRAMRRRVEAVLFDRDGTLVFDVPYNGDPDRVRVVPGAEEAIRRVRAAGVRVAGVSNQSGVGLGLIDADQVAAVNRRVEAALGPFDGWFCCPHTPEDGCACRKPAPGLVAQAAQELHVDAARCALIGDTAADIEAAMRAGALGILVPTPRTPRAEVERAALVAPTIGDAVELALGGAP